MLRLLMALLLLLNAMQAMASDRYVLSVGANDGGEGRAKLRYASQDAESFSEVLRSLGNFTKENSMSLQQPDRSTVLKKINDIGKILGAKPDSAEFVFYYSGHADDFGLLLGKERLPYAALKDAIKKLPGRTKLIIIDACSSGSLSAAKGGSKAAPFLAPLEQTTSGFAVVTSSSADESAQESERLRSSIFTHFLLGGLRGAADNNKDKLVSLSEAYQYANAQTMEATSKTRMGVQHPTYDFQLKGRGDLILTDLRKRESSLEFPPASEGIYYVRSTTGSLFLEYRKKAGTAEIIALEPGRYEIVNFAGDIYQQGFFELKSRQKILTTGVKWQTIPSEKVAIRGDYEFPTFYESKLLHFSLYPSQKSWDGTKKTNLTTKLSLSPIIASVERLQGLGFGVIGSMTRETIGASFGGGFNYNQNKLRGAQISLGANFTEELSGFQFAPLNYAFEMNGVQLALLNIGNRVDGAQIGLINIAEAVDGTQFGLINYAERSEGISFAPITIVKDGILRAEVWTDHSLIPSVAVRSGTSYFYSTLFFSQGHQGMVGIGPGLRLPHEDEAISLDATWSLYRQRTTEFHYSSYVEPAETQIRNAFRIRLFYETTLSHRWHALLGVSRLTQRFTDSEKRRIKTYGPLMLTKSDGTDTQLTSTGLMFGVSYSLLEGHK